MGHRYLSLLCMSMLIACCLAAKEEGMQESVQKFSFKKEKKVDASEARQNDAAKTIALKPDNSTSPQEAAAEEKTPSTDQPAEGTIYFNFDNASLTTVLNYLVDRKNMDVIPHKDLQNIKVSLVSREPMSLAEAWETMLVLMEANNFTIVNVNGINRVVPLNASSQNSLPCYSSIRGTRPQDLPDTNAICRYIYFCKNLKVDVASNIISPLVSDKAVQVNSTLQACIITDNCNYIKSALRIIEELDINGMRQTIKILQLRHTSADQLARLLNEQIVQGQQQDNSKIRIIGEEKKREMSFFSKDTKIFSEAMHNRLIFMGMEDAINRIINFINKHLDVPLDAAKSRLRIKELKYYSAPAMKELLDQMIAPPKGLGGATGLVEGEYKFFQDVVITPETPSGSGGTVSGTGNRLIISCNPEDWQRLSTFIDQIDKPQPQVAIEMMIVDVEIDDETGLGGKFRTPNGLLGNNINVSSFMLDSANANLSTVPTNVLNNIALESSSSIISFGNASSDKIWGAIRTMYGISHSNVISQPYLVANNNTKGTVKSSVTHLIPTVQTNNSTQPVQTDVPQSADITAQITPHVNAAGIIKLEIHITVDEFKSAKDSNADKTNREITIQAVSMAAGEVLVLGGLANSKHANSTWAVPILGAIPILGNLFRDRTRETIKSNLYIFIRPTVIKPHFNLGADEYTQLKLDYAKYQVLTSDDSSLSQDPIQRYLFAPNHYNLKQKGIDNKTNRMPVIDDFAERRRLPNEVEMAKDPLFHKIQEASDIAYEPEEGFASMPHVNPSEYTTPGVFENLMFDDLFNEKSQNTNTPQILEKRQSLLRTQ